MAEALGFSAERLRRIDDWLRRQVADGVLPFGTLKIHRGGKLAFTSSHGTANPFTGLEASPETLVRIYSMTKLITSFAILMLVERGMLEITDPVGRFIPAFSKMAVMAETEPEDSDDSDGEEAGSVEKDDVIDLTPANTMITIKHLLTHTSGLMYGGALAEDDRLRRLYLEHRVEFNHEFSSLRDDVGSVDLAEMCDRLAKMPLLHHPGSKWVYSYATDVLGRVVEVCSGKSLREFFREEIFTPLGMVDTDFWVEPGKVERFASAFLRDDHPLFQELPTSPLASAPRLKVLWTGTSAGQDPFVEEKKLKLLSGGGGLVSTVSDFLKFADCITCGGRTSGGEVLLGPKTLKFMMMNHLPSGADIAAMGDPQWLGLNRRGQGFGLGGAVITDPAEFGCNSSQGEFSWNGAINTVYWSDPQEGISVCFATQLLTTNREFRRHLRTLVNGAVVGPVTYPPKSELQPQLQPQGEPTGCRGREPRSQQLARAESIPGLPHGTTTWGLVTTVAIVSCTVGVLLARGLRYA